MTGKGWVSRRTAWWVLPGVDPSLAGQMDQGPLAKAWDQGRSLELPQKRRSYAAVVKSPFSGTACRRITVAVKQSAFGAKVSLWSVPGTRGKGWEVLTPRSCLLGRWDALGSRLSGSFPQRRPREPHGTIRQGPKLADPSAGPSRPHARPDPASSAQRPSALSGSTEQPGSPQARASSPRPSSTRPAIPQGRGSSVSALLGPGTDFPALGPRLWGPPWAEGGSAGGPAPAPGSLGGGLGALLRETRFARVATHLRLLHPNPPRRPCPWSPVPAPPPLMLGSLSPSICSGRGVRGVPGEPRGLRRSLSPPVLPAEPIRWALRSPLSTQAFCLRQGSPVEAAQSPRPGGQPARPCSCRSPRTRVLGRIALDSEGTDTANPPGAGPARGS